MGRWIKNWGERARNLEAILSYGVLFLKKVHLIWTYFSISYCRFLFPLALFLFWSVFDSLKGEFLLLGIRISRLEFAFAFYVMQFILDVLLSEFSSWFLYREFFMDKCFNCQTPISTQSYALKWLWLCLIFSCFPFFSFLQNSLLDL